MKKIFLMAIALLLFVPTMAFAAGNDKPSAVTKAADLRSDLDKLLSEHFVLAVMSMTKEYDGAKDAKEVQAALEQNASDMLPAIEKLYGKEGANQFGKIFSGHNGYTKDLAMAVKDGDKNAAEKAKMEVNQFTDEFAAFLDKATEGKLPKDTAMKALRAHEDDVQKVFESYVNEDYKEAYQSFREGFNRMFMISKALSGAIVTQMPEKFDHTKTDTKAADLRSALNSLAAEHFALASIGLQKGYDGAKDYDFVNWAEDQHTMDFKAAIASIYGDEGAAQFEKVWQTDHINAQGELAAAAAEGDKAKEQMAKDKLMKFSKEFGTFLGAATDQNLPEKDAQAAVKGHEETVIKTFDNYVAGDYEKTYSSFREGYAYMFGVGKALGGAIVTQMPDKFAGSSSSMPSEMPKTGFGGASDSTGDSPLTMMYMTLGAMAVLTGALIIRKKAYSNK